VTSRKGVEEKFWKLVSDRLPRDSGVKAIDLVWNIEKLECLDKLLRSLVIER